MVKVASTGKFNLFASNNIFKYSFIICLCFVTCHTYSLKTMSLPSTTEQVMVTKELSKRNAQLPDMKPWIEMGAKYSVMAVSTVIVPMGIETMNTFHPRK